LLDELSDASVHRSLSELSPILDDPDYNQLVILGGDLNTGTQWSKGEQAWNARDRNVLDRIEALGLVDCIRAKREPGRLDGCLCVDGWLHSCANTEGPQASARALPDRLPLRIPEAALVANFMQSPGFRRLVPDFRSRADRCGV
jgi:hypothetical protein